LSPSVLFYQWIIEEIILNWSRNIKELRICKSIKKHVSIKDL
jgi:hypothetical protein